MWNPRVIAISLIVPVLVSLGWYIYSLRSKVDRLNLQIENQKILTLTKDREIFKLKNILDNQNAKIKDLSQKQDKAVQDYKEWLKKENKFQKEINALLNAKGETTCDTLLKRLDLLKIKGYNGL